MAAAFAMVACQTDINEVGVAGGEVDVTFEVGTPTRAYSDGKTATVLQYAVYEGTTELEALTHSVENGKAETINIRKDVSFKLVTGNKYTVIFWAAAPEAPYTVDFGAKTMTVDYTDVVCNNENLDAFYAIHEFTVNGAQTETIELRRPFAQLNIGTNDYAKATEAGYTPVNSAVKVTNVYKTLDLWEGGVGEPVEILFDYNTIAKSEIFPYDDTNYDYLAMNYLLVPADKEVVDIEFGYKEETGDAKTRTVGSVPVQRNHRTNIYGQLLTSDVDINVVIVPEYDEPANTADALFHAAAFGGEVTLTEDVVLKAPLKVQTNMVLNLNGKTITTTEQTAGRHHYAIDNYATLVIEGEGAINARGIENFGTLIVNGNVTITNVDTNGGAAIWNEGKVTINNGTFKTADNAGDGSYGAALNTRPGGEAIVNGGTFEAYSQLTYAIINAGKTIINDATVKGKHGAVAGAESGDQTTINGGSFELLDNPGISDHCVYCVSSIKGGSFTLKSNTDSGAQVFCESTIATGYKAIEKDGKYYVVADEVDAVVSDATELQTALANSDEIVLTAGTYTMPTSNFKANTVLTCEEGVVFEGNSKLNINGATIVGATFSNPAGSAVDQTINGTFKGCTFEGSNGLRWCYAGETVVFEECVFSGSVYGVHFDGGANDIIFKNCTLSGFNGLGGEVTNLTFEGCTFVGNGKSGYNGANLWGNTKLINCEFTFDGTTTNEWIDCIDASKSYEITNCTVNGVAYTADNAATFTQIFSRNNATVKINGVDTQL